MKDFAKKCKYLLWEKKKISAYTTFTSSIGNKTYLVFQKIFVTEFKVQFHLDKQNLVKTHRCVDNVLEKIRDLFQNQFLLMDQYLFFVSA